MSNSFLADILEAYAKRYIPPEREEYYRDLHSKEVSDLEVPEGSTIEQEVLKKTPYQPYRAGKSGYVYWRGYYMGEDDDIVYHRKEDEHKELIARVGAGEPWSTRYFHPRRTREGRIIGQEVIGGKKPEELAAEQRELEVEMLRQDAISNFSNSVSSLFDEQDRFLGQYGMFQGMTSLKKMGSQYLTSLNKLGYSDEESRDILNGEVLNNFKLLHKVFHTPFELTQNEFKTLRANLISDGKRIFIRLPDNNYVSMYNKDLGYHLLKKHEAMGKALGHKTGYINVSPHFRQGIDEAVANKYRNLVGLFSERVVASQLLLSRASLLASQGKGNEAALLKTKAKDMLYKAAENLTEKAKAAESFLRGLEGEDVEDAAITPDEYSLVELLDRLENSNSNWSEIDGINAGVDVSDPTSLVRGLINHLSKPIQLLSQNDLNFSDIEHTGAKGPITSKDDLRLFYSNPEDLIKDAALFGMDTEGLSESIPLSLKTIGVFSRPDSEISLGRSQFRKVITDENIFEPVLGLVEKIHATENGGKVPPALKKKLWRLQEEISIDMEAMQDFLKTETGFNYAKLAIEDQLGLVNFNSAQTPKRAEQIKNLKFDKSGDVAVLYKFLFIDHLKSLINNATGTAKNEVRIFCALTSVIAAGGHITERGEDLAIYVADLFNSKGYRTSQYKVFGPLIKQILEHPDSIKFDGRTLTVPNPFNPKRIGFSVRWNKAKSVAAQSALPFEYLTQVAASIKTVGVTSKENKYIIDRPESS